MQNQSLQQKGSLDLEHIAEKFVLLNSFINEQPSKEHAIIAVLHRAQKLFGYLPKELQLYVARQLNVPAARVFGVVSFYSFFTQTPRGEHTINICMGTACFVKGVVDIKDKLKDILAINVNQTTPDGKFTLKEVRCIGACGLAPVIMVDDAIIGHLSASDMEEMVAKYRAKPGGQS
jgi:NADP-reducing hydrogenase subunit HndA